MNQVVNPDDSTGASPEESRRKKLQTLIELGIDPWGQRFDNRELLGLIRQRVSEIQFVAADGQSRALPSQTELDSGGEHAFRDWLKEQGPGTLSGPAVRAAGRIILLRDKGKLLFIDIEDWTGRIQLFVGRNQIGEENWKLIECLDLGDLIGVDGILRRTQTGELSIFADQIHVLCKTLDQPPAKHVGLVDAEIRQRRRYVDLAYNEGVRDRFLDRSKIVRSIRETLHGLGFVEIEGPTLHTIAGGAAARPFETHHNALDIPLVMRIALELHLKRLMVGGMERVFELGRVYRNEGISPKHNPEFTMLEVYQAYGNYESMMDLTEAIVTGALHAIDASSVVPYGDTQINFSIPFQRRSYNELFGDQTQVDSMMYSAM